MTLRSNKYFSIAVGAFIFATQASSASASTIWDNGRSLNNSGRCNSNGVSLCGDSGFTIYDDFNITSATKISSFTYDFATGFGGVYTSTRWSIWNSNPSINFSAGPIFAGTITGTVESLSSSNAFRATANGLSASLGAGTYWLGIQTNLTTGLSSYLTSNTNRLGQAIQIGNSGTVYSTALNDMSFSVSGTPTVAAVPEPATWAMMLVGFGMVAGMSRYRRRTAKVTFA